MASTDVNYINPSSMMPKAGWMPKNELAGMEWAQQARDYRDVFDQQMRLQAMAEEERRLGLEEKRANVPLQDAERQLKMETTQGAIPYARGQAAETAQTATAKQRYERSANYGDEALKAAVAKHKQTVSDIEYENWGRSQVAIVNLIERARMLPPLEGVGEVKRQAEILKKQGLDIPDFIINPEYWDKIYDTAFKSIKFSQDLARIDREYGHKRDISREGNASAERIAGTRAEAARDVQGMRLQEAAKTIDAELNQIRNDMANVKSWKELTDIIQQKYIPALSQKFDMLPQNEMSGSMARLGSDAQKDSYKKDKLLWISEQVEQILRARGFTEKEVNERPQQSQGGGGKDLKFDSKGNRIQ